MNRAPIPTALSEHDKRLLRAIPMQCAADLPIPAPRFPNVGCSQCASTDIAGLIYEAERHASQGLLDVVYRLRRLSLEHFDLDGVLLVQDALHEATERNTTGIWPHVRADLRQNVCATVDTIRRQGEAL